jgi:hypothetical protein
MSLALASAVVEELDPECAEGEETAEEPPPRHQKSQRVAAISGGDASGGRPRGTGRTVLVARWVWKRLA